MRFFLTLLVMLLFLSPVFAVDSLEKTTSYPYGKIDYIGNPLDISFTYDSSGKLYSVGGKRVWYYNDGRIYRVGNDYDLEFTYDSSGKLYSVGGKRVWYYDDRIKMN